MAKKPKPAPNAADEGKEAGKPINAADNADAVNDKINPASLANITKFYEDNDVDEADREDREAVEAAISKAHEDGRINDEERDELLSDLENVFKEPGDEDDDEEDRELPKGDEEDDQTDLEADAEKDQQLVGQIDAQREQDARDEAASLATSNVDEVAPGISTGMAPASEMVPGRVRADIATEVRKIVGEFSTRNSATGDHLFDDLGVARSDLAALGNRVNDTFGVAITLSETANYTYVRDIVNQVTRHLAKGQLR